MHVAPQSQRAPSRVRRSVLVAIPALNEASTVADVVAGVPREIAGLSRVDVLVIDDGSTDATGSRAREAGARVLRHERTLGVGAAFKTAVREAIDSGANLLVTLDADGQFNPADIPTLIRPVIDGDADFSTASRFVDPSLEPEMPRIKRWGNRQMSRLISGLIGRRFFDVSCGMRCYNRRALMNLNLMGQFTYTQEVLLNLAFKDMRIVEVPISVRGVREHGQSRIASNLWAYALRTSRIIFRAYRDYHPMRFFGGVAIALSVPALALWTFLVVHYLTNGSFTPHKWAGVIGAVLMGFAVLMGYMGLIGDLLRRHRIYLEEILFHQRMNRSAPSSRTSTDGSFTEGSSRILTISRDELRDPQHLQKLIDAPDGRVLMIGNWAGMRGTGHELRAAGFSVFSTDSTADVRHRPHPIEVCERDVVYRDGGREYFDAVIYDDDFRGRTQESR